MFKKFLSAIKTNIVDEAIEGIGNLITEAISGIIEEMNNTVNTMVGTISNYTGPGIENWNTVFGKGAAEIPDMIMEGCQIFGIALSIIFLIVYIIQYMINPKSQKETPFGAVVKLGIALFVGYNFKDVFNIFCEAMKNLQISIFKTSSGFNFSNMIPLDTEGGIFGIAIFTALPFALKPFVVLIALIVAWPIIKQFFRYLLEMVERYLQVCITSFFGPAVVSTIILPSTRNIAAAYVRMLFGQMFILCTNSIFLKGAVLIIMSNSSHSLLKYIFMIGYLRMIQRIDYFLMSIGLNVPQSFGGIMDSLGSAARDVAGGFRKADSTRKSAGNVLQAIGAGIGNKEVFTAGKRLSEGMAGTANLTDSNINQSFAKMAGQMGNNNLHISPKDAASNIQSYMTDPKTNADGVNNISNESLEQGISAIVGKEGFEPENISNVSFNNDGSVDFDRQTEDGPMSYHLSANDDGLSESIGEANDMYLRSSNTLANGESITGDSGSILEQTGANGMSSHCDMEEKTIDSIDSASREGNDIFYSSNGQRVAAIDKNNNVIQPSSLLDVDKDNNFKDNHISNVMSNNISKLYPDLTIHSEGAKFDQTKQCAYINVTDSNSNIKRVYMQDYVTSGGHAVQNTSRSKVVKTSSKNGQRINKFIYSVENEPEKTTKK